MIQQQVSSSNARDFLGFAATVSGLCRLRFPWKIVVDWTWWPNKGIEEGHAKTELYIIIVTSYYHVCHYMAVFARLSWYGYSCMITVCNSLTVPLLTIILPVHYTHQCTYHKSVYKFSISLSLSLSLASSVSWQGGACNDRMLPSIVDRDHFPA